MGEHRGSARRQGWHAAESQRKLVATIAALAFLAVAPAGDAAGRFFDDGNVHEKDIEERASLVPLLRGPSGAGHPDESYGYSEIAVSENAIDVEFVSTTTFTDAFSIRDPG